MVIRRRTCLLCSRELIPLVDDQGRQEHPPVDDCLVTLCDAWGVAVDDDREPALEPDAELVGAPDDEPVINLQLHPPVDQVMQEIFEAHGMERLGGVSSGRGWSSFSLFQRCPYAWKLRHIAPRPMTFDTEQAGLAVGSLIHAFLALYYTGMMNDGSTAQLTPEVMHDRLRQRANPAFVFDAWRVFQAYALYYSFEKITPLAIEYDLRDPRTGESCRYDLIAYFDDDRPGIQAGTYIIEHKSAGRFDHPTLFGWPNDGEILGQVALWKRLGLDKRFGELQGVIVNILGKQKEPQFHRTIVSPAAWQIEAHLDELKRWEGLIQLARSMDSFPRARSGCITRYGLCQHFDHCATND